jgi:hypothetical protein
MKTRPEKYPEHAKYWPESEAELRALLRGEELMPLVRVANTNLWVELSTKRDAVSVYQACKGRMVVHEHPRSGGFYLDTGDGGDEVSFLLSDWPPWKR